MMASGDTELIRERVGCGAGRLEGVVWFEDIVEALDSAIDIVSSLAHTASISFDIAPVLSFER